MKNNFEVELLFRHISGRIYIGVKDLNSGLYKINLDIEHKSYNQNISLTPYRLKEQLEKLGLTYLGPVPEVGVYI